MIHVENCVGQLRRAISGGLTGPENIAILPCKVNSEEDNRVFPTDLRSANQPLSSATVVF
jgi:hypothetical protein